jgi:hypothetical protein
MLLGLIKFNPQMRGYAAHAERGTGGGGELWCEIVEDDAVRTVLVHVGRINLHASEGR